MYTEISITKIQRELQELNSLISKLDYDLAKIDSVQSALRHIEMEAMQITCRKLQDQRAKLKYEIHKLKTLQEVLGQVLRIYQRTEEEIQDYEGKVWIAKSLEPFILRPIYIKVYDVFQELNIDFK